MGIKYLKGLYTDTRPKTTRPNAVAYPIGLNVIGGAVSANSANTTTSETFDVLIVAGGGNGGGRNGFGDPFQPSGGGGGGGGAGGLRVFSANSFNELPQYKNPEATDGVVNFIPVSVGGAGGSSSFGNISNTRGGFGGCGGPPGAAGQPGQPGGSGGGGGGSWEANPGVGVGGDGIAGQGCPGASRAPHPQGPGRNLNGAAGGAALGTGTTSGLTTSITGTNIRYADGGPAGPGAAADANRGNGGGGVSNARGVVPVGGAGGSGIVAVRYRNPAAPTTPLATGGDCICCTGGCIIHIFGSSGFLNVTSDISIN
jgi:hypothetical protein